MKRAPMLMRSTATSSTTARSTRRNPTYSKADYARARAGDKNLAGANLEGAYFEDTDLSRANLEGANLNGASVYSANVWGASFRGATLVGASFHYTDTYQADFSGADLRSARLTDMRGGSQNFSGANLSEARLSGYLVSAKMRGANLRGAHISSDTDLLGADFSDADLQGATLAGVTLGGLFVRANLTNANLQRTQLWSVDFTGADLSGADLTDAAWNDAVVWPKGFSVEDRSTLLREHFTFPDLSGSEAFRRWFGQSVVRDQTGRPTVLYHGTKRGGFTEFQHQKVDAHHVGFYFTNSLEIASTYMGVASPTTPLRDPVMYPNSEVRGAYRVYVKLERPLVVEGEGRLWNSVPVPFEISTYFSSDFARTFQIARVARDAGYDGVIFKNIRDYGSGVDIDPRDEEPSDVYVVFDPRNIKSATANVGTYDPNDPDIRRNPRSAASGRSTRSLRKRR